MVIKSWERCVFIVILDFMISFVNKDVLMCMNVIMMEVVVLKVCLMLDICVYYSFEFVE